MDKVITLDGYPKMVMTINGTVPGPPLIVYEGESESYLSNFPTMQNTFQNTMQHFL